MQKLGIEIPGNERRQQSVRFFFRDTGSVKYWKHFFRQPQYHVVALVYEGNDDGGGAPVLGKRIIPEKADGFERHFLGNDGLGGNGGRNSQGSECKRGDCQP